MTTDVSTEAVMTELRSRVRERIRQQLLDEGGPAALRDPALLAEVERMLDTAARTTDSTPLLLPELLGDPDTWRLRTSLQHTSHRANAAGAAIVFVKRRVLLPVMRWLFDYSRENFERQRRVNQVLFACVQELAIETARLRQEMQRRARGE